MGSEWKSLKAEQFCASVRDGTHASPKPVKNGQFLVTSRHITGGRHDLDNAYFISQEDFDTINKRSKVDRWDVLISMIGTVGEPCLIKEEPNFAIKNIGLFKSKDEAEGKWLYYYLKSPDTQRHIREQSRGTTQQYIPLGALREFPILVPADRSEMCAVVNILGALDDKIDLNRRMNRTLEETARAIFKSWFIDFDPVRAKTAIRREHPDWSNEQVSRAACPNLKLEIAALFPDAFDDSEMGEIPRGWGIHPIGHMVQVLGGGTPSTKEPAYWEGGIHPFCTPKDMASLSAPVLLQTERHLTDEGLAKVSSGKLPIGTLLLSSRAPIGYLAVAETPVSINQGIIAMVCDSELPNLYVLHWTHANMDRVIANANGSTFLEISKQNFRPIGALIPDKQILERFTQIVGPIHKRVVSSLRQIKHLAAIRDALLPKLISGELRVPDAERILEHAV
jgi:type I restriction enzyme S subunit